MALKKRVPGDAVADSLSDRIAEFQEGFRTQAKQAGVKDLAEQFVSVVQGIVPSARIDMLHRGGESGPWSTLVDGGAGGANRLAKVRPFGHRGNQDHEENGRDICIRQKLADGSLLGVVVQKSGTTAFSPADKTSLRVFVHLFDNSYREALYRRNEKGLVFSLNHRVLQLNSLIDTGIEVSKLDQDASPHQLALERAASLTNASKGMVTVKKGAALQEEIHFPGVFSLPASRKGGRLQTRFTFRERTYTFELFEKESREGIIPFEETDQLLLDALARQVHASLENRYLHEQALEKQRFEQEMQVAASIQQKIIPKELPRIPGYDIAGINIPSKSVGGDYYDCIPLPNGKYAIVIADVAGKGMPAALLVSSLHAYLAAYLESSMTLPELGARLNTVIGRASTDDKFITAIIAILHPETGEIESLNAGHNPGYLIRADGAVQEVKVGGLPLGMVDMGLPFESERITLGNGERLFFYTDGIPEAEDEQHNFYEDKKLVREFAERNRPDDAGTFISQLIGEIKEFTGSAPQSDDITALYLRRSS